LATKYEGAGFTGFLIKKEDKFCIFIMVVVAPE